MNNREFQTRDVLAVLHGRPIIIGSKTDAGESDFITRYQDVVCAIAEAENFPQVSPLKISPVLVPVLESLLPELASEPLPEVFESKGKGPTINNVPLTYKQAVNAWVKQLEKHYGASITIPSLGNSFFSLMEKMSIENRVSSLIWNTVVSNCLLYTSDAADD